MPDTRDWRKSSYSNGGAGACVEVAFAEVVAVRDSKSSGEQMITVTPAAWLAFVGRFTAS